MKLTQDQGLTAAVILLTMMMPLIKTQGPSPLVTNIRDLVIGAPAVNVTCRLFRLSNNDHWTYVAENVTDAAGRIPNMVTREDFPLGTYRIVYYTQEYYQSRNLDSFYPYMEIIFANSDSNATYLVPVSASPYGFFTYKGSLSVM